MRLHATGRDLIITEKERLISGSINIYTCEFDFDSSWDGYLVTAVFSTANKVVNAAIADGKCEIPAEVLRPNARLRIGVFGSLGDKTKPTTYSEWITVEQGADTDGKTGRPPEPTVYEQWMDALSEQNAEWAEAEAAREEAEKMRGKSAVYVGSGEIPEGFNIQIDPEGEAYVDEIVDEVMKEVVPLVDAADNVFVATYGETTFDELVEAHNAGKVMVLQYNAMQMPCVYADAESDFSFGMAAGSTYYSASIDPSDEWHEEETSIGGGGGGGGGDVPSIDEIVEEVLAALPTWDGGEF